MKNTKTTSQPLVSVVMPVFNAERFLREAIESIIHQTYTNWELLIVDDCSTDGSVGIIKEYKTRYPKKIKLLHLKKKLNSGGDAAANFGFEKAKGKYFAKMDADDIAHPKRFAKQVEYLEHNPHVFLVGSNATVINDKGEVIGEKLVPQSHEEIYKEYFNFHPIIHPTIMVRKSLIKTKYFYDIKYKISNDYYTLFKLLCKGYRFVNLPDKLLNYRIYNGNTSLKNIKKSLAIAMRIKLCMVVKYDYKCNLASVLKTGVQFITGMILPQRVSFFLYLVAKGIIKKEDIATKILSFPKNFVVSRIFSS